MIPGGSEVNTTLPLLLNIAGILCCCTTLPAVIGLVFSIQAINAKKLGDAATAQGKNKIAMILGIVSVALGVVGWVIYLLLGGMSYMSQIS
jgi:Interferon-induced transmembrane protein